VASKSEAARMSSRERPASDVRLRQGPRPLPLHLGWTMMAASLASSASWPRSKSGWPGLNAAVAASLAADIARAGPDRFHDAVLAEARRRLGRFMDGVLAYRRHPYRRSLADPPVLWQSGTTRLLDYGGGAGVPLFVVPSLINRAYILDLLPGRSLLRSWAERGLRPFLVDWGRPGEAERGFDLTRYVLQLEEALAAAAEAAGSAPVVLGYCMGGLLALALAERRVRELAGLVLLATPWDFHAERPEEARALAAAGGALMPLIEAWGEMPVDLLQAFFAAIDPFQVPRKFQAFAAAAPDSDRARLFVALEDWLNDGVPLAAAVARECLIDWYGGNTPGQGAWRVAGAPVRPERLRLPTLVVVPGGDRIVPPASAAALATRIPRADRLDPATGHIGMVAGGDAERLMWRPVGEWVAAKGAPARPARRSMRRSTRRPVRR
jgi:poly[(R)-3-hydroxyalkanoate] polymerase subunit PhaC